jgi:predicted ribosome-associated RNA-binding protein Tma20
MRRRAGIEVEDVLMIEDGAIVFASSGADFMVPTLNEGETSLAAWEARGCGYQGD